MLALFAANHGAVMPALQPALQLRGGMSIGGVEPEQVATGLNLLLGVQGLMMIQNQEKIHEVYDVKATPISEFFTENGGAILTGSPSPARWPSAAATRRVHRARNIPTNLQNIKDFVAGTADNNGWGAPASSSADRQRRAHRRHARQDRRDLVGRRRQGLAIWFLANAVGLYALPNQAMEGWASPT